MRRIRFLLEQFGYDLATGLLFRPGVWIAIFVVLGLLLPYAESELPGGVLQRVAVALAVEPGAAQVVLATIAGSMMTVVSVVYSIFLVALSLASIQFSTRILAGFLRDRAAQDTLGLFVGTFVYCLLVLRSIRVGDAPFVPPVSVTFAVVLALVCLGGLVWFIHHIIQGIQANFLVDRIATETEAVIDDVFPTPLEPGEVPVEPSAPPIPDDAAAVLADCSGYIQLVDVAGLGAVSAGASIEVYVARSMGAFVPQGLPLVWVSPAARLTHDVARECAEALDLGPVRTMQWDAEFGVRQIVDIALKAISPAVNDPSTAATCIDHLDRLLVRVAGRRPPIFDHRESGRVVAPSTSLPDLIDLAFEQLRQYGRTDMAVALRLMRALGDVASVARSRVALDRIESHARVIEASARAAFPPEDCEELGRRRAAVARFTVA